MRDKVFLDTNIFVYSIDASPDGKEKAAVARELIQQHVRDGTGVISMQVLQEFYQVSTQKIKVPLTMEDALEYLHYVSVLETVHPDFTMLVDAVYLIKKLKLSFWDALIVQAAAASRCTLLLTEDLQSGLHIGELSVRNPFMSPF